MHVEVAHENLQSLLWNQANEKNTISDYEQFVEQYPDSQYVEQAQKNIEKLYWLEISSKGNIEDVKKFIELYPDGEYVTEARNRFEYLIWDQASSQNDKEKIREYLRLYPSGRYIEQARDKLNEPWPVYIDWYHLYESTHFDRDYRDVLENQINEILSKFKTIKIVPERSDAAVHLQIGYALDFRDGQAVEDNISKFIENFWRDRAIVKQERAKPTFDIALQVYLWDVQNDCLLAFSSSLIPPDAGNAEPARTIGRDRFLDAQVKTHIENSIIPFLGNLRKGKDDVMNLTVENPTLFIRHDIGKPKKRVCLDFRNGTNTIYYWRDPTIERYIYYHLQQSDMDCVCTFDFQDYKLAVMWSKYDRMKQIGSVLREYGLKADFLVFEKNRNGKDKLVFSKSVLSDIQLEKYGFTPVEVITQWRKIFENSFVVGEIMKVLKNPPLNAAPLVSDQNN